jgi:3-hydroxyacyl-CoA dehydrogenase
MPLRRIAVIGSGVMGAGIAAHIANSGTEVLLYDIVKQDNDDKNFIAKAAIERLKLNEPPALTHPDNVSLITPCNLEDDLYKLALVDWVIEAIVERVDLKKELYQKLEIHCHGDVIISSNTSTIPLNMLLEGRSDRFKQHFLITHFFNPPRYMRLLELVKGPDTLKEVVDVIEQFTDVKLGKGIVWCNDTPGFIANRIGCYWLEVGLKQAIHMNIKPDLADKVMSKPVGIPKTGIFGLMDLIGIDLMQLIAGSFNKILSPHDEFNIIHRNQPVVQKMIENGLIGRKGKGGFYRIINEQGKKIKQVINLTSGEYEAETALDLPSFNATNINELLACDDIGAHYAKEILWQTFYYAAKLIPEITDNVKAIDDALKLGFNWKFGPFELLDQAGVNWLIAKLEDHQINIPPILKAAKGKSFYKSDAGSDYYLTLNGDYKKIDNQLLQLNYIKRDDKKLIYANDSARLWDIGDSVACIEFTSKMNSLNNKVFNAIERAFVMVDNNYKGLVIASESDNFCVGADLKYFLELINKAAYSELSDFIEHGQNTMQLIKYAPFPVISALTGLALGGGCELLLHSYHVEAYIESYTGLVETGVGLIPGWGGCKEMVFRIAKNKSSAAKIFEHILLAKVSKSATISCEMLMLKANITMNKDRLLSNAKALAIDSYDNFKLAASGYIYDTTIDKNELEQIVTRNSLSEHDKLIASHLITIFTADGKSEISEKDLLQLEKQAFIELCKTSKTKERIEYMLSNGKALRN